MRSTFIISFILSTILACSQNQTYKTESNTSDKIVIDTIIELNSPSSIDLSRNQFFIDTSKSSRFYEEMEAWDITAEGFKEIDFLLNGYEKYPPHKPLKSNLPSRWIRLHKIQNQIVAYKKANGSDWRFKFTDSTLIYFTLEPDIDVILNIEQPDSITWILTLAPNPHIEDSKITYMKIRRCNNPMLYTYSYSSDLSKIDRVRIELITPLENIRKFNLLVEHSPNRLIRTNLRFENISLEDLE